MGAKAYMKSLSQHFQTSPQNLSRQCLITDTSLLSSLFQLTKQLLIQTQSDLLLPAHLPFATHRSLSSPPSQFQNDVVGRTFQKLININLLPKGSLFFLAAELWYDGSFSLRHPNSPFLSPETAQLLFAFRFISGYDPKGVRFFQSKNNHQRSSRFGATESDVAPFSAFGRVSAVDCWLRFKSLKNFIPSHPMFFGYVFFRPFGRIDSPDTVEHPSPTLPFPDHFVTFRCSPLAILNHSSQFVKQRPIAVILFAQNGGEKQCLVSQV